MENPTAMAGSRPPNESAEPTPQFSTKKLVAQLWMRMTGMYTQTWTTAHGDTDDGTWEAGLAGLGPEDFARGLRRCLDHGGDWPPSLPTFRQWCKPPGAAHPPITRALPEPESVQERRAATARHWHHMWVLSGLKPIQSLSGEERTSFREWFGEGPFESWDHDKIQDYCRRATSAIHAKCPLPELMP